MRLHLKGSGPGLDEITMQLQTGTFMNAVWQALGYTQYEVICIGASGGYGGNAGGWRNNLVTDTLAALGHAPGGGGLHRVSGLLSALPDEVPVVVGVAGVDGNSTTKATAQGGMGGSGGATTFGGTICRASGGTGGVGGQVSDPEQWLGGIGGIGNSTTPGGGGLGGFADASSVVYPAQSGWWDGSIGAGGGGGTGGLAQVNSLTSVGFWILPSAGGIGNYDAQAAANPQAVAAGQTANPNLNPLLNSGRAFSGGGANSLFLTGASYVAGTSHYANWLTGSKNGACFIKLT